MKLSVALGFSLVELLTAVAVTGIVLMVGVPAFQDTIRSNILTSAINDFVATLNFARSEAVKRSMRVTVRRISSTNNMWEGGWQVFTDNPNGSGSYGTQEGSDEILRVHEALKQNYTLRNNSNFNTYISFKSSGESNTTGSFALCDNSDGTFRPKRGTARLIIINSVGRVRMATDSNKNGIPEDSSGNDLSTCYGP